MGSIPTPGMSTASGFVAQPGLCASCRWLRLVESRAGSSFILCRKSETDARFPRYPSLPVLACDGYERRDAAGDQA